MNFYSKNKFQRNILLFILLILISEIFLITKIFSVKKDEIKSINAEIKNTEEKISNLKPKVKVKSSLNKDYRDLKNDSVIGRIESPVFNDVDESLSFKINSSSFNDLIHISNNYNYKMLLLNKTTDDRYNAEVIFTNRKAIVNQNDTAEADISPFKEKIKNTYKKTNKDIVNKKISNSNTKSNNKSVNKSNFSDVSSKTGSKTNLINNNKNLNVDIAGNICPIIKYNQKINIGENDIKLLLSEDNFGEIIYNDEKDIFEIYFNNYSGSEYPNIIKFCSKYNIKALSFEVFYPDSSVNEIGLLGDELYENISQKEINEWNKLFFYDTKNVEGIYFIIKSSLTSGFCIKNVEVYI